MVLNMQVGQSREWIQKSRRLIHGVSFELTAKAKLSLSLLHLSLEHENGMCCLAEKGLYGSAIALFRPQFEAYVRGIWLYSCATEEQLLKFLKGDSAPSLHEAIEQVEKSEGQESGPLKAMKKALGKDLNDYTHGGSLQVLARSAKDGIANNYDMDHVESVLLLSSTLSFRTCLAISKIVSEPELGKRLLALYQSIWADAP
jgi:hypothetical protein